MPTKLLTTKLLQPRQVEISRHVPSANVRSLTDADVAEYKTAASVTSQEKIDENDDSDT
jgi:hypothetical protein